jgi:hypothetical protein
MGIYTHIEWVFLPIPVPQDFLYLYCHQLLITKKSTQWKNQNQQNQQQLLKMQSNH